MARKDYDVASEMLSQKLTAKGVKHKVIASNGNLAVYVDRTVSDDEIPKSAGGWPVRRRTLREEAS